MTRPRTKRGANPVPEREFWRLERDAQYDADLAKDPAAAAWLEEFDRGLAYGTRWRRDGDVNVHDPEKLRELNAERMARARNPDVLTAARGPALEEIEAAGGDPDAFLARHTSQDPGAEEDAAIARLDWERAVALRRGEEP